MKFLFQFSFTCALSLLATKTLSEQRPFLTLSSAQAGIEACIAFANENELKFAISVKDRGGRLVAFARMDDVYQKQIELSHTKAETAATTPLSTKQIAATATNKPSYAGLVHVEGLTTVEGGIPIRLGSGYSIGGIGVSGSSPELDGECALLAVNAAVKNHHASKSVL
tara:strand:+ start:807 stop:1310 length:504 start_codon:yes stop_codon:yes gene_type:complete